MQGKRKKTKSILKKESTKEQVRLAVKKSKSEYSVDELKTLSLDLIELLEMLPVFTEAKYILAYCSMKDELDTSYFLEKYKAKKKILLPVVVGEDLVLKEFEGMEMMQKSSMGILEPQGAVFTDYDKLDLVLVPGVAFDRKLSRMGRGRGFYDRLLPSIKAKKIGLCFDFQVFDIIPSDPHDVKMDMVVAENEIIWE